MLILFVEGCYLAKKGYYTNTISKKNIVVFQKEIDSIIYKMVSYAVNDTTYKKRDISNYKSYVITVYTNCSNYGDTFGSDPKLWYKLHAVLHIKDSIDFVSKDYPIKANYMEYRKAIKKIGRYVIINKRYKIPLVYDYDELCGKNKFHLIGSNDFELFRIAQSVHDSDLILMYKSYR